jgi:uncharacterized YigZ family protein
VISSGESRQNNRNFAAVEQTTDRYSSIASESTGIYREKASKFIAVAIPVTSEADVKASLEGLRKRYFDANHHCYAYRIGFENQQYRTNDDGEPSGSAGKPIYGQLLSRDLYDILVVVIRYFGGTKLGIPGLIHAYRSATAEALMHATVVEKIIVSEYQLVFDYPMMNEVMRIMKDLGGKVKEQGGESMVEMTVSIRRSLELNLTVRLERLQGLTMIKQQ